MVALTLFLFRRIVWEEKLCGELVEEEESFLANTRASIRPKLEIYAIYFARRSGYKRALQLKRYTISS